jgi:hypothetical protein
VLGLVAMALGNEFCMIGSGPGVRKKAYIASSLHWAFRGQGWYGAVGVHVLLLVRAVVQQEQGRASQAWPNHLIS